MGSPAAPPAPKPPAVKVEELIRQLGDRDYFVRQKAQAEIAKLGFDAFDALTEASTSDDLEVVARAKYLLRLIRIEWTKEGDPPEVKRQLRDYEYQTFLDRKARMEGLASIPDGRGVSALCRLVRFEQSEILSKQAAAQILRQGRFSGFPKSDVAQAIRAGLGNSRRTAARWLTTVVDYKKNSDAALAAWTKFIDVEQTLLRRLPGQTDPQIVATLLRVKVNWLQRERRVAEAVSAMQQLIELEKGDLGTLVDQVEWLVDQKAWKLVDEVASRFTSRFASHPALLYAIAQSQAARGDLKAAEETARRAFGLHAGGLDQSRKQHLIVANHLMRRGQHAWAEREYRAVIAEAGPKQPVGMMAHYALAEMLHDQGKSLLAGQALQAVADAAGKSTPAEQELATRTLGEVRARMHYFFACDWLARGDRAKYRQELDLALAADPSEIDTLIACYRLADAPEAFHRKVVELIRKAADDLREAVSNEPEDPDAYNQYAWLIGNTEGDYEEALRFSKTSLELRPDTGGFYDTLARVYFAKKDYAQAVASQTRALELDPHSGQIARQLELFKKAAAEHAKPKP